MKSRATVLIAGIGGASLGTEIFKCLRIAEGYVLFGCDISKYAYGHYQDGFTKTFVIERERYTESVYDLCMQYSIQAVIPGGEEPLALLGPAAEDFKKAGVQIAANSPDAIATCSDKKRLFERLRDLGIPMPSTTVVRGTTNLDDMSYPCIVKPATGTGGSRFVFLALNQSEVRLYSDYLSQNGNTPLAQEYVPVDEGEFTVGVLSLPNGRLVGSVAMRRLFDAKLSVSSSMKSGLVSSGYSQGLIDEFLEVRAQAEGIAKAIGSCGPINIQGRLRDGVLLPFEINPRFSASTYLRAMAGFNEVDIYLRYVLLGNAPAMPQIQPGYYLRSLSEVRVAKEEVK